MYNKTGRIWKNTLILVSIFLILISTALKSEASTATPSIEMPDINYTEIINALNMTAVWEHITFLSSLETRVTGSPGNDIAAQYIYQKFKEYGLKNVFFHNFTMPVVVDLGANITILEESKTVRLYPILPNFVCPSTTPPEGITGQLIYAGDGYIWSFDGKPVNGSIVLMNWDTRDRWINAAKLGAKAVIFLPPPEFLLDKNLIMSLEGYSYDKYLPYVPFNFPRFYVNGTDVDKLLNSLGKEANLVSTQRWKNVESRNVIGFVEGGKEESITYYDENLGKNYTVGSHILLSSYYDSYSVSPSMAPGAEEATGISSLLEFARYYAKPENKPLNGLVFAAFGGHAQYSAGAYAFARDFLSWMPRFPQYLLENVNVTKRSYGTPETVEIGDKISWNLNLDFGTGSNILKLTDEDYVVGYNLGYAAGYGLFTKFGDAAKLIDGIVEKLNAEKPHGKTYEVIYSFAFDAYIRGETSLPRTWDIRDQLWRIFPFDTGWMTINGRPSFTFTNAYDPRPLWRTPFDTLDRVDFANLKTLLEATSVVINGFVNYDDAIGLYVDKTQPEWWKGVVGMRGPYPGWIWGGFLANGAIVAIWNESIAWYTPVSGALAFWGRSDMLGPWGASYLRVYTTYLANWYMVSDESGWVEWTRTFFLEAGALYRYAFEVDEETGNLISAPQAGAHGWSLAAGERERYIGFYVIFNCSTFVFFDGGVYRGLEGPYELALSEGGPLFTWPLSHWGGQPSVYVYPVPANGKDKFLIGGMGTQGHPMSPAAILKNNSMPFTVNRGDQIVIPMTSLRYAEELYKVNKGYFDSLIAVDPSILSTPQYKRHIESGELIQKAREALAKYQYSKAESLAVMAYVRSQNAYVYAVTRIRDAATSIPYLAIAFVPLVFFVQKLIFPNAQRMKRVLSFLGLFALLTLLSYLLHPGFTFATNPIVIILGLALFILCLPIPYFIFAYILDFLRTIRLKYLGRHELEVTAFTGVLDAFFTGVENMRRHRLRAVLLLLAIVIVVSSIVNLTAIEAAANWQVSVFHENPTYQGLYIRQDKWGSAAGSLPEVITNFIMGTAGENVTIAPRAWKYHIAPDEYLGEAAIIPEAALRLKLNYNGNIIQAAVLWGISSEDFEFKRYQVAGRWFLPGEKGVIILSESQAKDLGINVTEVDLGRVYTVFLDNMEHQVVGIVSDGLEFVQAFDREFTTPIKRDFPMHNWIYHSPLSEVFILPYEEVMALGGETRSLSVEFKDPSLIEKVATGILELPTAGAPIYVYAGVGEYMKYYVQGQVYTTWGIQNVIVPAAIGFFSIINVLLGAVMERKGTIEIYSVIGLSPIHISLMFLAESFIYGLFGGTLGFLLGMAVARFGAIFLPGIPLNFSSGYVLVAMAGGMLTPMVAAVYPAILAARMVTPSLERTWRIPTKPRGDAWEIPYPVYFPDEKEVGGAVSFIKEYFDAHRGIDAPDFYIVDRETGLGVGEMDGKDYVSLTSDVRLFPYDEGVAQNVSLCVVRIEPERWQCRIILNRKEGEAGRWEHLNRRFLDIIRKQLLLWRSLKSEEREKYIKSYKKPSK